MSDTPFRQPARRAFAHEINEAKHSFKESDDDRAPNFALLPTGAKANRVFFVGTFMGSDTVGDGKTMRGRFIDNSGQPDENGGAESLFVYASAQYQPDCFNTIENLESPAYVAVLGKPRVFSPEDSDEKYVSIRPERIFETDAETRDQWVIETAQRTHERAQAFRDGGDEYVNKVTNVLNWSNPDRFEEAAIRALEEVVDGVGNTSSDDEAEAEAAD